MSPLQLLNTCKSLLAENKLKNLEPLLGIFQIAGNQLNLVGREPMIPLFTLHRPKRTTVLSGRQISKSFTLAELLILFTGLSKGFKTAIVEPRFSQKKNFNRQILTPLLRDCFVQDMLIDKAQVPVLDAKVFKSGGDITLLSGYQSADSARGSSGICFLAIDEIQDILSSSVPVFESITDAMTETGFRMFTGTAKTSDGTLAMKFDESSQGHWCIKCPGCEKHNIAALEEQLIKMIGKHGCSCAFCGKLLDVTSGYYVHKYPSRIYTHVGYHMPQIIFGFHNTPTAWTELLYKMNHNSRTLFYNEALGVPDDDSVRMLTKEDLLKARNNVTSKKEALDCIHHFHYRVLGVDWGGGGGGDSATGVAVICKNAMTSHFECIYMDRLQQGLSPEQEAAMVNRLAKEFQVSTIAHDYTGAGFIREALFLNKYPEWANSLFPVSYSYRPTSDLVSFSGTGSRGSYVVDKTKSLLLTINAIKYNALFLPWFDAKDPTAVQLDFLSIIEHEQKLTDAEKNEVQRASNIFLLDKVAGKKDDAAQAVNIGLIAMCHMIGQYPIFTFDDKFNLTEAQYHLLVEEK